MGRPAYRSDIADLESFTRAQNEYCSRELLEALVSNHGRELLSVVPEVVSEPEPDPPKPLPPIPNAAIAAAAQIAFPKYMSRVEAIQRSTLSEFPSLVLLDIRSQRRTKVVVRARQVAMYLAKTLTGQSLPEIGRRFGGRDHTTVLHSVRKIERLISVEPELAAQVERIKAIIPEGAP